MIGRTNVGGGSGDTGATLVVSAPADVTVTATKDNKTYTRVANSDGIATFKGLSSGRWALSIFDASHDPTTPVDVIIVADYNVTLAFFSAAINITYPAGSTCKAVHTDGTELTAPDTSGTWSCIVPSAGTWTVMCYDGASYESSTNKTSAEVEITSEGQSVSVELSYTPKGALYWVGDEVSNITGGWLSKTKYDGTVTFGESSVTINCPRSASAVMVTNNSVDMSEYSYIVLQLESAPTTSGGYQFSVLSQNVNVTSYDDMVYGTKAHVVVVPSALDSGLSIKLDISSVNDGYVAFGGADSSAQTMVVKSITMI